MERVLETIGEMRKTIPVLAGRMEGVVNGVVFSESRGVERVEQAPYVHEDLEDAYTRALQRESVLRAALDGLGKEAAMVGKVMKKVEDLEEELKKVADQAACAQAALAASQELVDQLQSKIAALESVSPHPLPSIGVHERVLELETAVSKAEAKELKLLKAAQKSKDKIHALRSEIRSLKRQRKADAPPPSSSPVRKRPRPLNHRRTDVARIRPPPSGRGTHGGSQSGSSDDGGGLDIEDIDFDRLAF